MSQHKYELYHQYRVAERLLINITLDKREKERHIMELPEGVGAGG